MSPRSLWAVALVLVAVPALQAQGTEKYLPSNSQIFAQADPRAMHEAAYKRTLIGKNLSGDLGKCLVAVYRHALLAAELFAVQEKKLSEEQISLIKKGLKLAEKIDGLSFGLELSSADPPQGHIVLVLDKMGGDLPDFIAKVLDLHGLVPEKEKVGSTTIRSFALPQTQIGWWNQDGHALIYFGTDAPADYLKKINAGKTGLAGNSAYKGLKDVAKFETTGRAYVDYPVLVATAGTVAPQVQQVTEELGLKGFGVARYVAGYEKEMVRLASEMETTGPRDKGLLQIYNKKSFKLADLPPLPSDLSAFQASNFNPRQLYDIAYGSIQGVAKAYAPGQAEAIDGFIAGGEGILGIKLKDDFFNTFDDLAVQYDSPSEGFFLGKVLLLKVKDEAKLKKTLKTLVEAVPNVPFFTGKLTTTKFRGADVHQYQNNTLGNYQLPTFAVHKGYLVIGSYPQGVRGYILRADGVIPKWTPTPAALKALEPFPKQFVSISYADAEYPFDALLSILPIVMTAANGAAEKLPGLPPFDVNTIPHPQTLERAKYPSISITTDDGKKVRSETRAGY
ncbi:MAG TPA: hypothetical protein VHR72_10580 [Gemmataceae bacterium]|jgi:hypothetical protein|nr:hypothetical protein [Gemmataceae bacterium]